MFVYTNTSPPAATALIESPIINFERKEIPTTEPAVAAVPIFEDIADQTFGLTEGS